MRRIDKRFVYLATAVTVAFSPMALSQVSKESEIAQRTTAAPAPLRELFFDLDVNGDRVIEKREVPESELRAFETLLEYGDANHDGKLDAQEYRDLLERVNWARIIPPAQRERQFKTLDRNEDGKLDRREFPGAPGRFDMLDKNRDGFLSRDEIPWLNPAGAATKPAPKNPKN
jgi:hypothetical protein